MKGFVAEADLEARQHPRPDQAEHQHALAVLFQRNGLQVCNNVSDIPVRLPGCPHCAALRLLRCGLDRHLGKGRARTVASCLPPMHGHTCEDRHAIITLTHSTDSATKKSWLMALHSTGGRLTYLRMHHAACAPPLQPAEVGEHCAVQRAQDVSLLLGQPRGCQHALVVGPWCDALVWRRQLHRDFPETICSLHDALQQTNYSELQTLRAAKLRYHSVIARWSSHCSI